MSLFWQLKICHITIDPPCTSLKSKNRVCLTKSELVDEGMGFVKSLMKDGDPCFLFQKKKRVDFHLSLYLRIPDLHIFQALYVNTTEYLYIYFHVKVCFVSTALIMTPCSCEVNKCGCEINENENKELVRNTKGVNTKVFEKSRRPSKKRKPNRPTTKLKSK